MDEYPEPGQWNALHATGNELAERIKAIDAERLAALSPAERQAQFDARSLLYQYFGDLWHSHKRQGLDPHDDMRWAAAAALSDLLGQLEEAAHGAVRAAASD